MESSGSSTYVDGLAFRRKAAAPPDVLRPFDPGVRRDGAMPQRRVSDQAPGLAARRIAWWFRVGRAVRLASGSGGRRVGLRLTVCVYR